MSWPPDIPDTGIPKPKEIERLEEMEPHIREAMTKVEIEEHIEQVAMGLAKNYKKFPKSNYECCMDMVALSLELTGGAIGGKLGIEMLGDNRRAAEQACRIVFDHPVE